MIVEKTDQKRSVLNLWRTLADDFRTVYREKLQNSAAN